MGIVLAACLLIAACERQAPPEQPSKQPTKAAAEPKDDVKETKPKPPETKEVKPEPGTAAPLKVVQVDSVQIAGVAFTEKLIELLEYELSGRSMGWRPNDLIIGRLTDNVDEFQLGALEAIRYTAIKLKESLTRFGDADAYDPHLVEAVNLLMNRADQFWFPSAESQYEAAVTELKGFLEELKQGRNRFYYRTDNLMSLVASYKDLLGNCHENLVKEKEPDGSRVSHFQADNYFYYCQGVAHVMYEILKTVRVGFSEQLQTLDAADLMNKIVEDLKGAVEINPWVITNSDGGDILANHRYHLAAPISSALHNMSTMLRY